MSIKKDLKQNIIITGGLVGSMWFVHIFDHLWVFQKLSKNGIIPRNKDEFIKLKGVGPYIDAAVRSIGYNDITPTIDGNVNRVVSRLLCIKKPPGKDYSKIYKFLITSYMLRKMLST